MIRIGLMSSVETIPSNPESSFILRLRIASLTSLGMSVNAPQRQVKRHASE
jgi:hypothetical protein